MKTILFIAILFVIYKVFLKKKKGLNDLNRQQQDKYRNSWAQLHPQPPLIPPKALDKENGLATFTLSSGTRKIKNKKEMLAHWVKPGEVIKIKGSIIKGGYFFLGWQLQAPDDSGSESSLVNDTLEIEKETLLFQDNSLNYWPKFIYLSPKARGAYLDWLASARDNAKTHIGYVFIYFYGIERRIVVDSLKNDVGNDEFIALFTEIQRLQTIYKEISFFHYSTRFLELMCLLRPKVVTLSIPDFFTRNDSLLFKHQLAITVKAGKPLPFDLAFAWLKYYPEYRFRTPTKRCENEFHQLFKIRYYEELGEGIVVSRSSRIRLRLKYWPASSTLGEISLGTNGLFDPSVLNEPINKIMTIADLCTDELAPLSRYLSKAGTSPDDIGALLLFPDKLLNAAHSVFIQTFKQWVERKNSECFGVVSVLDFWLHVGSPLVNGIKQKDIVLMQQLAQKIGYGVAPEQKLHHAKPTANGMIVLFPNEQNTLFTPSTIFNEIRLLLHLATTVHHDSEGDSVTLLPPFINNEQKLAPNEKRSLHAYLLWCIHTPKNMTGLKAELRKIGKRVKNAMAHILVCIALSNGKISSQQIKQLEKLYGVLGLEKSRVTSDVYNASLNKVPVTTLTSAKKIASSQYRKGISSEFRLDDTIVARQQRETKEVQTMLETIFIDEEDISKNAKTLSILPEQDNDRLDPSHNRLLTTLMDKEKWTRIEIENICQAFGLMVDGAIETINDWSFDTVDAPVLENDDDIYVDQAIANELKMLKGSL